MEPWDRLHGQQVSFPAWVWVEGTRECSGESVEGLCGQLGLSALQTSVCMFPVMGHRRKEPVGLGQLVEAETLMAMLQRGKQMGRPRKGTQATLQGSFPAFRALLVQPVSTPETHTP